jgi:hypothetical protein
MPLPTIDELVAALDQSSRTDLDRATSRWFNEHGFEVMVPGFIAAFPRIKRWTGRNTVLFEMLRFARKKPEVAELAKLALRDAAYMVRWQACAILAYSLRKDAITHLEELLHHRDEKTRADATAAIDAINHQNHHYWYDRKHTGRFFWEVNPQDHHHG